MLYETGQGVPQNYAEAVKWYRESAERGYPAAQFNLGVFYETGQVVEQDFAGGRQMVSRRRRTGMRARAMQSRPLLPDRTRRRAGMQEAVKWFIRAARQGDKTAQHNLGLALRRARRPAMPRPQRLPETSRVEISAPVPRVLHSPRCSMSIVSPARSQPSTSDFDFPATNNAAAALSRTASRFGPRFLHRTKFRGRFLRLPFYRRRANRRAWQAAMEIVRAKSVETVKPQLLVKFRNRVFTER
jgi:TPR repeat protein